VVSNWGHAHHPFWGDRAAPIEILTKGCEHAMAKERAKVEGIDLTASRTPQSSTPRTSLEWEKLSEMEMSPSHFFGPDPIQRIARGDQETFFEVAPTLEKLGIAVGPMVVNKLYRIMKVRLTARFVETGTGEYGLLWRYSEFGAVKIAMCPKEMSEAAYQKLKEDLERNLEAARRAEDRTLLALLDRSREIGVQEMVNRGFIWMESSDLMTVTEAEALTITDKETNEIVRNALKRTADAGREQRREDVVADMTAREQQWHEEYPSMEQDRMDVETKMTEQTVRTSQPPTLLAR
jgi:hypothetical protein